MKNVTALENLGFLLCAQIFILACLLVALAVMGPKLWRVIELDQKLDARAPVLEKSISTGDAFELRLDADTLLRMRENDSAFIESALANSVKILGALCLVHLTLTGWLMFCYLQLRRQQAQSPA